MATCAAADEADRSFRPSQARGERPPDYSGDHHQIPSSRRRSRVDWGDMDGPTLDRQPRPVMLEEPLHSSDLVPLHSPRRQHRPGSRTLHPQSAMYNARTQEMPIAILTRSATEPNSQRRSLYEDDLSRSDSRRSGSRRDHSPRSYPIRSAPESPTTSLTDPESDSDVSEFSRGHPEQREFDKRPRGTPASQYQSNRMQRRQQTHDDVIFEEDEGYRSGHAGSYPRRRRMSSPQSSPDGRGHFHTSRPQSSQRRASEFDAELGSSPDSRRRRQYSSQGQASHPPRQPFVTESSETGSSLSRNINDHGPPKHCNKRIKPEDTHHTQEGYKYGICSRCTARICYRCGVKWKKCDCPAMPRRTAYVDSAAGLDEYHTNVPSRQIKRSDARETEYCQQPSSFSSPPDSPTHERVTRSTQDSLDSPQSRDSRIYHEHGQHLIRAPPMDQDGDALIRSIHGKHDGDLKRRLGGSPGPEGRTAKYYADGAPEATKSPQSTALTHSHLGTMVPVALPLPPQQQSDAERYALGPVYSHHEGHPQTQSLPPPAVPNAPPSNDYYDAPTSLPNQMAAGRPAYSPAHYQQAHPLAKHHSLLDESVYTHSYPPPYSQAPVQPQMQISPRSPPQPQVDPHWQHDAPRSRQREHSPSGPYSRSLPAPAAIPPPVPMPPPAVPTVPSEPVRPSDIPGHLARAAHAPPGAVPSPPNDVERHSRSGDYVANVSKARTRRSSQERRMAERFNPELRNSFAPAPHYHVPMPVHPGAMHVVPPPPPSIVSLHHAPPTPMHHHVSMVSPAHHHQHTPPRPQHAPMYAFASPVGPVAIPLHHRPSVPMIPVAHVPMGPMPQPAVPLAPGHPFGSMPRRHTMDDEMFGSNNTRSTRSSELGPNGGSGRRSHRHVRSGDKHGANGGDSHSPSSSSSRRRQRQNSDSSTPTASRRHHPHEAPYLEDEREETSHSKLAGLSGSGRGMNRVLEWNEHVALGSAPQTPPSAPASVIS